MANGLTTKQAAFVAAYIGESRGNATDAAIRAGYSSKTARSIGSELLTFPDVQAAVQAWRDEVKQRGIANLEYRVNRLDDLERRYWDVIDARQKAYAGTDVIGGETGIVVLQHKMVGSGPDARLVEEYVADTAVSKEIRSIYDDVAKELGQRIDKVDMTGNFKREYVIVRSDGATETPG